MDKKRLNNEIVLCRPAVRKAKVAVIRKILKKMKILNGCKIETMKEKKFKKSERLFEKVQIMKRLKVDEVTKFALRNSDLQVLLKNPELNLRQSALACLAQHDAVVKKINSIREQIPNWQTDLPLLIDSLGKKIQKKSNNKEKSNKITPESNKSNIKIIKKDTATDTTENNKHSGSGKGTKTTKNKKLKSETGNSSCEEYERNEKRTSKDVLSLLCKKVEKIEKIDDPFFIEKKVIAPKLLLESLPKRCSSDIAEKFEKPLVTRGTTNSEFHKKPFKAQKNPIKLKPQAPAAVPVEDRMHPSWAAKKFKLIRPFEGKKTKFSDE